MLQRTACSIFLSTYTLRQISAYAPIVQENRGSDVGSSRKRPVCPYVSGSGPPAPDSLDSVLRGYNVYRFRRLREKISGEMKEVNHAPARIPEAGSGSRRNIPSGR